MKAFLNIVLLFLLVISGGCKEDFVGQPAIDGVAPGKVKNPVAESIPGGAKITYDLPNDYDLLGVKAVYYVKGEQKYSISSMYNNFVTVEGYGTTEEQKVYLYTLDKSNNESAPVEVKIQPGTPPGEVILNTLEMVEDFGGVLLTWKNPMKANIALYLLAADEQGELQLAKIVYSSATEGSYNLRGFDDAEREFGVYIRDRWDNYTPVKSGTYKPYFEFKLDKTLWKRKILRGDNTTQYNNTSWAFEKMFDEIVSGSNGWHTKSQSNPFYFTIDLGVTAKLSRYELFQRLNMAYRHYNPKRWRIYGCVEPRTDMDWSDEYWIGVLDDDKNMIEEPGFKEDWALLIESTIEKPSGSGPIITDDDLEAANLGHGFFFGADTPPVRYIRFQVDETFGGSKSFHISELSLFGQLVNPNENNE